MNLEGITAAIIARVQADTGANGVWETAGTFKLVSFTDSFAPEPAETAGDLAAMYPYGVLDVRLDGTDPCYATELFDYSVDIHIYDNRSGQSARRGKWIVNRLIGNAKRTPDYGLSRHLLVTINTQDDPGTVVCDRLSLRSVVPNHERDAWHWMLGFDLKASRALAGA